MREYAVAILGATGAVGQRLISELEKAAIPVKQVKLLASKRSAGKKLQLKRHILIHSLVLTWFYHLLAVLFQKSCCLKL